MPIKAKELKSVSWRSMRAAAPSALLITLVFFLLTSVLATVVSLLVPPASLEALIYDRGSAVWISLFLTVLIAIYRLVMDFGYHAWSLRVSRGYESGFGHLMDGFGMAGKVLWMEVLISLRIFLWSMVVVSIYTMVMAPVVLMAGPSVTMLAMSAMVLYGFMIFISLRYSLAPFLLYDYPNAGAARAIRRSTEMTRGRIGELVKLHLSFWPWYLGQIAISLLASMLVLLPMMGDFSAMAAAGQLDAITLQAQAAINGAAAGVLDTLFTLPLTLFFKPYLNITLSNYYRHLSGELVTATAEGANF